MSKLEKYYPYLIAYAAEVVLPGIAYLLQRAWVKARFDKLDRMDDSEAENLRRNRQNYPPRDLENKLTEIEERKQGRRKEENRKSRLLRVYSFCFFFVFFSWLTYLIYGITMNILDKVGYYFTIGTLLVTYGIVVWESVVSAEKKYIFNLDSTLSLAEYIESMRRAKGLPGMMAVAYHYETGRKFQLKLLYMRASPYFEIVISSHLTCLVQAAPLVAFVLLVETI